MYGLQHSSSLSRATLIELGQNRLKEMAALDPKYHSAQVRRELRLAGVTPYGLIKSESRYLPRVIHPEEHIGGVVYGRHEAGSVMLIATDRRVIFLDKKPLFINEDDLTYDVVSGVSFGHAGIGSTVTLHTRVKDYTIRTLNTRAAERFVQFIEIRCLEHTANGSFNR